MSKVFNNDWKNQLKFILFDDDTDFVGDKLAACQSIVEHLEKNKQGFLKDRELKLLPLEACKAENTQALSLMIQLNVFDLNYAKRLLMSPLHIACTKNNYELVYELINNGHVDMNKSNMQNKRPIEICCEKGYSEIIALLLANGAEVFNNAALHYACESDSIETAKLLIKHHLEHNAPLDNAVGIQWTALKGAFFKRSKEIAKLLIENGADPLKAVDSLAEPFKSSYLKFVEQARAELNAASEASEDFSKQALKFFPPSSSTPHALPNNNDNVINSSMSLD